MTGKVISEDDGKQPLSEVRSRVAQATTMAQGNIDGGSFVAADGVVGSFAKDGAYGEGSSDVSLLGKENVEAPQLTVKAITAGLLAGSFGAFLAIYNGLKTGIVPSLNIIAALLGYFICKGLLKCTGGFFTPQENVVIQTVAVAVIQVAQSSGFASGLLAMGKNAAQIKGPGQQSNDYINLNYVNTLAFCASVGFFGLFIAFPLRKYCIIDRKLTFPSGTATAAVIRTMHASAAEAWTSFKILVTWAVAATVQKVGFNLLNGGAGMNLAPFGGMVKYGIFYDWDLSQTAIGMILPNTINASVFLGGIIGYAIIGTYVGYNHGCDQGHSTSQSGMACWYTNQVPETYASSYQESRAFYFFPGVAMVIIDGFYSIFKLVFMLIKSKIKPEVAVADADDEADPREAARQRRMDQIFLDSHLPLWLMLGGWAVCVAVCVFLVTLVFHMPWWQVLIACGLSPIFSVGIIVGVGMTDWDVSSSFGKLMLIPFGAMNAGSSLIPSLAACMIIISGCGAAAGMMQNFKTGYLLGASPRTMVVAQLIGAIAGVAIAPALFEIFNAAYDLPGDPKLGGIFGTAYRLLAGIFASDGIDALPKYCIEFCLVFALLALVLNVVADVVPDKWGPYLPNTMALSLGLMLGPVGGAGLDFLIGGLAISCWRSVNPEACKKFSIVVASGCIAGGGIAQLINIILRTCGVNPFAWPAAA